MIFFYTIMHEYKTITIYRCLKINLNHMPRPQSLKTDFIRNLTTIHILKIY